MEKLTQPYGSFKEKYLPEARYVNRFLVSVLYRMKVNGIEVEIDESDILALVLSKAATDYKLNSATFTDVKFFADGKPVKSVAIKATIKGQSQ